MRVLRVELKCSVLTYSGDRVSQRYTQVGPYVHRDIGKEAGFPQVNPNDLFDEVINPEPNKDDIILNWWCMFGFKDAKQLIKWFHYNCLMLHKSGYVVAEYEVPPDQIDFGNKQIQFPREAELISMRSLGHFFHQHKDLMFED
jgi:hypothetical protein